MFLFPKWGVVQTAAGAYGGRVKGVRLFGRPFVRMDLPIAGGFTRVFLASSEVRSFVPGTRDAVERAAAVGEAIQRQARERAEASADGPADVIPFERPGA